MFPPSLKFPNNCGKKLKKEAKNIVPLIKANIRAYLWGKPCNFMASNPQLIGVSKNMGKAIPNQVKQNSAEIAPKEPR